MDLRPARSLARDPLKDALAEAVSAAIQRVLPAEFHETDPLIRPSDHADYQSNVSLALAKRLQRPPREVADDLARAILDDHSTVMGVEVSGPGFLNITLADAVIWARVAALADDERLGVGTSLVDQRTVIDYSGPNVAKEMHVGHLRTTIIGDALVRVCTFLGADVLRQNHLGDWGTQFGMIIQYLAETPSARWRVEQAGDDQSSVLSRLDELYRATRQHFEADAAFADRSRRRVVALQAGDPDTISVWQELVQESERVFQVAYDRLGVLLEPDDSVGESAYNSYLAPVVQEVMDAGVGVESDGALCVFPKARSHEDDVAPMILRKSDGGYGYAATDLATIRHRVLDLKAVRILYVVDARQSQHFDMIFEIARRMGWLGGDVEVVHVAFGTVLGPDGKPFKTRSGSTVRLQVLLDAAVHRARQEIVSRREDLPDDELDAMAEVAGIGAVKYADLSTSRAKDYIFDLDRMVSFSGNTGVYLQYAHARLCSILRKVPSAGSSVIEARGVMHPAERALSLELDLFGAAVIDVAGKLEPHRLCVYLFDLAKAFTDFYEACPVVKTEDDAVRANRVVLCQVTQSTLATGLALLGIHAPERM